MNCCDLCTVPQGSDVLRQGLGCVIDDQRVSTTIPPKTGQRLCHVETVELLLPKPISHRLVSSRWILLSPGGPSIHRLSSLGPSAKLNRCNSKALSHMGSGLSSFRVHALVGANLSHWYPSLVVVLTRSRILPRGPMTLTRSSDSRSLDWYLNRSSPPAQLFLLWRRESSALTAPDPAFPLRTSSRAEEI